MYLTAEQRERLRALSRRTGVPQAELVRRALTRHLDALDLVARALTDPAYADSLTAVERLAVAAELGGAP
jgi:hypothetical protein